MPVVDVTNVEPPFNSKAGGYGGISQAGVAAQTQYVGLRCPSTLAPNFRAVVKAVINNNAGTSNMGIVSSAALDALVAGFTETPIDGNWDGSFMDMNAGTNRSPMKLYNNSNAIAAGLGQKIFLPQPAALGQMPYYFTFVLQPGQTLLAQSINQNVAMFMAWYWDEYNIG
jgi:hypothetical protein